MKNGKLQVRIQRYDPEKDVKPYFQTFEVPYEKGNSVLNALNYIYENLDRTISYYYSCRIGRCTGCDALVNGETKFICTTLATDDMTLEPLPAFTVIRDLVVDKLKIKKIPKKLGKLVMGR